MTISPENFSKLPRTLLTIMCRTENPTSEWTGSIVHLPATYPGIGSWSSVMVLLLGIPSGESLNTQRVPLLYRDCQALNYLGYMSYGADWPDDEQAQTRWLGSEQQAWRAFLNACQRLFPEMDAHLQHVAGIPHAYYEILVRLSEAPGRELRMTQLADASTSSKSRLSHAVARLEARGWIERLACPTDRRGQIARLTDVGFAALDAAAHQHVDQVRRMVFDRLTPAQVEQLAAISAAIEAASRRSAPPPPRRPATRRPRRGTARRRPRWSRCRPTAAAARCKGAGAQAGRVLGQVGQHQVGDRRRAGTGLVAQGRRRGAWSARPRFWPSFCLASTEMTVSSTPTMARSWPLM